MFKWLHHLLTPHCSECQLEKECKSCDMLRQMLEIERNDKRQILQALLNQHGSAESQPVSENKIIEPINRTIPWRVRQQMLETEDRQKAQILKAKTAEIQESNKSTEQLEAELLGDANAGI